jgi:protein SCO1/2
MRRRSGLSALAIGLAALLVVAGCGAEAADRAGDGNDRAGLRGRVTEDPGPRPDFVLDDMRGGTFDFRARTDGYLTLLFFGYTHCPDVCPIHMSSIAEVKRDLGAEFGRRTRVVFVTVDPRRDTPERLRSWLGGFDPDFIGLYGDPQVIDRVQLTLGLPPAVVPDTSASDYEVGHAAPVIAFPATDSIRVAYPFGTRQADWLHDLALLFDPDGSADAP